MKITYFTLLLIFTTALYSQEEFYESYIDGRLIKERTIDSITVTTSLRQIKRSDGKYYIFDVSIINNSSRTFTFKTDVISARIYAKNGKSILIDALTRKEYIKIKDKRQNLRMALAAVAGGINAANAGYSSSTSNSNSYTRFSGSANTTANATAYGSGGYAYGSANSNTNFSGNVVGSSTTNTRSYNGSAAYAAQQNESEKIQRMAALSLEAKQKWNIDYLKNNTLFPQTYTSGLINIKFYKAMNLDIIIKTDNKNFTFEWNPDDSEN